jgi:haloalkane dehalogenase
MNTMVGPPKPGFQPTTFHKFFSSGLGAQVTRRLGYPQRSLGFAQGDRKSISGEVARAYRYPLRGRAGAESVTALIRMVPDTMDHPSVEALRTVQDFTEAYDGPAAIVWGDKDPVLGRVRNRMSRMLPQAPVTVTQGGHFLQEEVPVEIAAAIRLVSG